MPKHSIYGPSGLADKMLCLGRHLPTLGMDGGSSPAADRGTECHDVAESVVRAILNDEAYDPTGPFKEEWQEQCIDDMVNHALEEYNNLAMHGEVIALLEETVSADFMHDRFDGIDFDMSQVFGTCDVIFYSPSLEILVVLDYKTGVGISVRPEKNVQLSTYALMALGLGLGDVTKVRICISQPRLDKDLRVWETMPADIFDWACDELVPALISMSQPGAPRTPGKKQCQWCPLSGGDCDAERDEVLALFDDAPEEPTGDDLSGLLKKLPLLKQFIKHVEKRAMETLTAGKELPGFKLVKGRGSRNWTDEAAAGKFLAGQGLKDKERHSYKLLTPPAAEKALMRKKGKVSKRFNALVVKNDGKNTWAPEDDKREAVIINPTALLEPAITLDDLL